MNKIIQKIIANDSAFENFKSKVLQKNVNLNMSFLKQKTAVKCDSTFSDASEFWSSHDNIRPLTNEELNSQQKKNDS